MDMLRLTPEQDEKLNKLITAKFGPKFLVTGEVASLIKARLTQTLEKSGGTLNKEDIQKAFSGLDAVRNSMTKTGGLRPKIEGDALAKWDEDKHPRGPGGKFGEGGGKGEEGSKTEGKHELYGKYEYRGGERASDAPSPRARQAIYGSKIKEMHTYGPVDQKPGTRPQSEIRVIVDKDGSTHVEEFVDNHHEQVVVSASAKTFSSINEANKHLAERYGITDKTPIWPRSLRVHRAHLAAQERGIQSHKGSTRELPSDAGKRGVHLYGESGVPKVGTHTDFKA